MATAPTLELLRIPIAKAEIGLSVLAYSPPRPSRSVLMMIPGLTGGVLGGRHDYRPLAERLSERGYGLHLVQLRCANDFAHSDFEQCADDIAIAVGHATTAMGIADIALFGTSMGGPRVAFYMARGGAQAVKAVGFLSSIKSSYEEAQIRMAPAQHAALDTMLHYCRGLVARGRGGDMVKFENFFPGRPQALTAKSFLSYFGAPADTNASTVKFLGKIAVPALVIHGTKDDVALAPNAEAIHAGLTAAPARELIWVEGGTHYLEPGAIAEGYALRIADWVAKTMPARPA